MECLDDVDKRKFLILPRLELQTPRSSSRYTDGAKNSHTIPASTHGPPLNWTVQKPEDFPRQCQLSIKILAWSFVVSWGHPSPVEILPEDSCNTSHEYHPLGS
jgi:hypothetical protein